MDEEEEKISYSKKVVSSPMTPKVDNFVRAHKKAPSWSDKSCSGIPYDALRCLSTLAESGVVDVSHVESVLRIFILLLFYIIVVVSFFFQPKFTLFHLIILWFIL